MPFRKDPDSSECPDPETTLIVTREFLATVGNELPDTTTREQASDTARLVDAYIQIQDVASILATFNPVGGGVGPLDEARLLVANRAEELDNLLSRARNDDAHPPSINGGGDGNGNGSGEALGDDEDDEDDDGQRRYTAEDKGKQLQQPNNNNSQRRYTAEEKGKQIQHRDNENNNIPRQSTTKEGTGKAVQRPDNGKNNSQCRETKKEKGKQVLRADNEKNVKPNQRENDRSKKPLFRGGLRGFHDFTSKGNPKPRGVPPRGPSSNQIQYRNRQHGYHAGGAPTSQPRPNPASDSLPDDILSDITLAVKDPYGFAAQYNDIGSRDIARAIANDRDSFTRPAASIQLELENRHSRDLAQPVANNGASFANAFGQVQEAPVLVHTVTLPPESQSTLASLAAVQVPPNHGETHGVRNGNYHAGGIQNRSASTMPPSWSNGNSAYHNHDTASEADHSFWTSHNSLEPQPSPLQAGPSSWLPPSSLEPVPPPPQVSPQTSSSPMCPPPQPTPQSGPSSPELPLSPATHSALLAELRAGSEPEPRGYRPPVQPRPIGSARPDRSVRLDRAARAHEHVVAVSDPLAARRSAWSRFDAGNWALISARERKGQYRGPGSDDAPR